MLADFGKTLVIIGASIALFGGILWLSGDHLKNFPIGRLPSDILIQNENFTFYLPITTGILLSLVVSGIFWVTKFFFR